MFGKRNQSEAPTSADSPRSTTDLIDMLSHARSADEAGSVMSGMTPDERRRAANGLAALNDAKRALRSY